MHRRTFVSTSVASAAAALAPDRLLAADQPDGRSAWHQFEINTTIELTQHGGPLQLWVPTFLAQAPGQRRLSQSWESEAAVQVIRDPSSGVEMLHVRWDRPGGVRRLRVLQRIATWDRVPHRGRSNLTSTQYVRWTRLAGSAADQILMRKTAQQIVQQQREPVARLRAIYDWVVANAWRDGRVRGCGPGDAAGMLRQMKLGGKCADINGLTVCLARAAGIPARELYGLRLAGSARFASLGRSGDVTDAQHCRAEAWLPGRGWLVLDPADVRKAVLEEQLPVEHPKIVALQDALFGSAEANWAAYNRAKPVDLPGSSRAPRLPYLMYPTAMSPTGEIDPLDPERFAYRIESRAIQAA